MAHGMRLLSKVAVAPHPVSPLPLLPHFTADSQRPIAASSGLSYRDCTLLLQGIDDGVVGGLRLVVRVEQQGVVLASPRVLNKVVSIAVFTTRGCDVPGLGHPRQ